MRRRARAGFINTRGRVPLVYKTASRAATRIGAIIFLLVGAVPVGRAEDTKADDVTVTKTAEKLNFKVPPDWPIEKRGGVMAPIPIEEYLGRKFTGISAQLQALEERLNGLDVRVRVLEEAAKKNALPQQQGLRSGQ